MRQVILQDFPQSVDFEPYDRSIFNRRVVELAANPGGSAVLGGLQQDFLRMRQAGVLASVDDMLPALANRGFLPGITAQGKLESETTYFIPWMQATYLMAASKRALPFLPKGADLNQLRYEELLAWAANIYRATGKGRLGFPVGPNGLMVRFLQGYLYPSFTGTMSDGFSKPTAVPMWQYLRELWRYVAPSSLILDRMDNALLNGEVWVAWDHTARLLQAFREKPDDFVAFPAPVGPKGRGFISIMAGLGMPRGSTSSSAQSLIEYLTRPLTQVQTMESVGFLPVVEIGPEIKVSRGLSTLVHALVKQSNSGNAILTAVPIRAAADARRFDLVYLVAFSRIVLRNMDTADVLARQQQMLLEAVTSPLQESKP